VGYPRYRTVALNGLCSPEIEATPEIIAAGEEVIFSHHEELIVSSLAVEVYRAMELAKKDQRAT
jgi:hypothetical protein